jgi:predicted Rossmann fold flavoprotein
MRTRTHGAARMGAKPPMTNVDVLIVGAGAAGLMCAIHAGRRGRRVLILEHADSPGKKILISGGGRCNFTNRNTTPENFLSANPHFARSALARFTAQDFVALVEEHRIPWHEKTLGQLFCDRSAHDILNMLLAECAAAGVRIQLATRILSVVRTTGNPGLSFGSAAEESGSSNRRFRVETSGGLIAADSVVIATGGLSIPKMGATSFGYDVARQFAHPIVDTRPALVPLVFSPQDQAEWCDLAGLSAEVIASFAAQSQSKTKTVRSAFREKMLITHRGLSGPAILQISSYWRPGEPIELDLAPTFAPTRDADPAAGSGGIFTPLTLPHARRDLTSAAAALRAALPARMAARWLALHAPAAAQTSLLSNAALAQMDRELHAWQIVPAGTEGYGKAEVTAGGVSTDSLDARSMQSRIVPGLYFIGEVVDVTGWLGGYNFQWAWASGFSAGQSA